MSKMSRQRSDSMHIPLRQDMRDLFDMIDTDRDGHISYQELWNFLRNDQNHNVAGHIVRRIHEKADRNDDGRLDCQEFLQLLQDPDNKHLFGRYFNRYMCFLLPPQDGIRTKRDVVDGAYEEKYSCWPPRVTMIIISLVMFVLFIVDATMSENTQAQGRIATALIYDPHRRREAWRYLTYMFVHVGFFHLFVNLLIQILLGVPLEMVHKWWRVLIVYLSGVIAGSLGTSVTDSRVYLAGASGGVYSLLTAHIATILMNWREMTYPFVQMGIFVVIIVTDVGTSIYNRYVGGQDDHIGYAAHFFGALAGLLVGITVLKNLSVTNKEKMIKMGAWSAYLILMTAAIVVNVVGTHMYPKQDV